MEQVQISDLTQYVSKDTWTMEDYNNILQDIRTMKNPVAKICEALSEMEADVSDIKGSLAVKVGIARYLLCRFESAIKILANGTDNKERRYFQAMSLKHLRRYSLAEEEFERARKNGWDSLDIDIEIAQLKILVDDIPQAQKILAKIDKKSQDLAKFHYACGMAEELLGNTTQAVEKYEQAREIESSHPGATFRLAHLNDMHGNETEAIELYIECTSTPPVFASALLNLAVLYEDFGQYIQAEACLRRILAINPNHQRAKLYLKDVRSSNDMYYDEDRERKIAARNALLDVPVTDFELSVRARNCLRKMNIRTHGDLVSKTESELLGYKNFGETSLKEIKLMLGANNLRLGQDMEEKDEFADFSLDGEESEPVIDEATLEKTISQLKFSTRCHKALESIDVKTVGDLTKTSREELMECKNFGKNSLDEVRQKLDEFGLCLKDT